MSDAIGMDPVDLEGLVDKVTAQFKEQYDKLPEDAKVMFRNLSKLQIQEVYSMLEREREQTINHVLQVFDVAAQTNNIAFIREAIVRFKKA